MFETTKSVVIWYSHDRKLTQKGTSLNHTTTVEHLGTEKVVLHTAANFSTQARGDSLDVQWLRLHASTSGAQF